MGNTNKTYIEYQTKATLHRIEKLEQWFKEIHNDINAIKIEQQRILDELA